MDSVIAAEIAKLETMTASKLVERFEPLVGECVSGSKQALPYPQHIQIHNTSTNESRCLKWIISRGSAFIQLTTIMIPSRCKRFCSRVDQLSECEPGHLLSDMESTGFGSSDCLRADERFPPRRMQFSLRPTSTGSLKR
jgi:hypothetical protein